MTTKTAARPQLYWEDVAEGQELPGIDLAIDESRVAKQVSGSQDFYRVHHDRPFARAAGHPDIFLNTGFTRAALGRLVTDWIGDRGWLLRFRMEMRRQIRPGTVLRLRGRVVRKYQAKGQGRVDLELAASTDAEGLTTPATATVSLPTRS